MVRVVRAEKDDPEHRAWGEFDDLASALEHADEFIRYVGERLCTSMLVVESPFATKHVVDELVHEVVFEGVFINGRNES